VRKNRAKRLYARKVWLEKRDAHAISQMGSGAVCALSFFLRSESEGKEACRELIPFS